MGDRPETELAPSLDQSPLEDLDGPLKYTDGDPFSTQLDYPTQTAPSHAQGAYDFTALAGSLPVAHHFPAFRRDAPHAFQAGHHDFASYPFPPHQANPSLMYGIMAMADSQAYAGSQQQHFWPPQYGHPAIYRPLQIHNQGHQQPALPYMYGMSPSQYSPLGYRNTSNNAPLGFGRAPAVMSQETLSHRPSEPALVPSFPRGPPRKPKQSGHALWIGNLPPTASITDLKDHFSRDATQEIESVFLISKSNCAFVNYRSEAACLAAMHRFHDSRFGGVRLVCRLRRGSTSTTAPPPLLKQSQSISTESDTAVDEILDVAGSVEPDTPTIVRGAPPTSMPEQQPAAEPSPRKGERVPDKYFIVKSLTQQDLQASVVNGIWATQSHNESILNGAYETADNVYLIFSANKSGEYFGYARMASASTGKPTRLHEAGGPAAGGPASQNQQGRGPQPAQSIDGPRSISTTATATAPKGRIIDDSARGTIFWEAEELGVEDGKDEIGDGPGGGQDEEWGRQFRIEWICVSRLPFYRTRGLRNPWNSNREVKIARDGTELEPSIGQRLMGMFH